MACCTRLIAVDRKIFVKKDQFAEILLSVSTGADDTEKT